MEIRTMWSTDADDLRNSFAPSCRRFAKFFCPPLLSSARGRRAKRMNELGLAGLQIRQLAGGDHRAGGLAGRRAARRLKRNGERGTRREPAGETGRDLEPDRLTGLNESGRARPGLTARNKP